MRFVRDDEADPAKAGFAVGLGDRVTGQVESLGCSFMFALPPAAEGYPAISAEFDGLGSIDPPMPDVWSPVSRVRGTYGEPVVGGVEAPPSTKPR